MGVLSKGREQDRPKMLDFGTGQVSRACRETNLKPEKWGADAASCCRSIL